MKQFFTTAILGSLLFAIPVYARLEIYSEIRSRQVDSYADNIKMAVILNLPPSLYYHYVSYTHDA